MRFDSMGMAVPAHPERLTETNMEMATTRPNVSECHRYPITPTTTAHTAPRMAEVWICRQSGSHQRLSCTCPVARPRTTMVTDCRHVLPDMAWITGMNDASRMTLPRVRSK